MSVAGIDYGIRRIAVSIPAAGIVEELLVSDKDESDALLQMATWLRTILNRVSVSHVVIEKPIQGASRNVRTGLSLGMVAGALTLAVKELGLPSTLVAPSSWKKAVVGRGNADKSYVEQWLELHHPELFGLCKSQRKPQDGIDATCIALSHPQA